MFVVVYGRFRFVIARDVGFSVESGWCSGVCWIQKFHSNRPICVV